MTQPTNRLSVCFRNAVLVPMFAGMDDAFAGGKDIFNDSPPPSMDTKVIKGLLEVGYIYGGRLKPSRQASILGLEFYCAVMHDK